jgi:hypothetical protein
MGRSVRLSEELSSRGSSGRGHCVAGRVCGFLSSPVETPRPIQAMLCAVMPYLVVRGMMQISAKGHHLSAFCSS